MQPTNIFLLASGCNKYTYRACSLSSFGNVKSILDWQLDAFEKAFLKNLDRALPYHGLPLEKMYLTSSVQLLIDAFWAVMPANVCNGWPEVDKVQDLHPYKKLALKGKLNRLWAVHDL